MGRNTCCDGSPLKKGPWSPEEDQKLITHVQNHGQGNWKTIPKLAGINRCGKSCRLRWINYLRPNIKRGKFTREEEGIILNLHSVLGNKWSAIARQLPGRTDNEIKNFWNTHLKKKLIQMGFDPMTHRPRINVSSSLAHIIGLANLKQLMDNLSWEEHALRLLHQQILQPPSLTNIINNNNPTEIEIMNLINSLSSPLFENQIITQNNNNYNYNNNPLQALGTDSVGFPYSHLPSLEIIPNNTNIYETTPFNMKEMCLQSNEVCDPNNSPWQLPSSSTATTPPHRNIIHEGPSSNTNCGDACSSSSFVGSSASNWPDHLLLQHSSLHNTTAPPPPWL